MDQLSVRERLNALGLVVSEKDIVLELDAAQPFSEDFD